MPFGVLIERERDVAERRIALCTGDRRKLAEEERVENRLGAEIQRGECLTPVVRDEHLLDEAARGLPCLGRLPESRAFSPNVGRTRRS